MTALTVPTVVGWRPGELLAAADRLTAAAGAVSDDARVVRRHLADALDDAAGAWAATAAGRAHEEARTGEALAESLRVAADALRDGAARLAAARERLLDAVERARAAGLEVTPEGRVPAPPPGDAFELLALTPDERAATERTAARCADLESGVLAALADVAATDEAVAELVGAVEPPATLPSLLEAHRVRTALLDGDHVAALGAAGGAVVAARTLNDARSLVVDGRRLADYASLWRQGAPRPFLEEARSAFAFGTSSRPLLKVAGRVSLPATVVTGARDAGTGGGYDGVRGWVTRGLGAAGAGGAGLVLAGSFLAPGVVVAGGAAVLAYGAWSAGNHVVDHWDQVEDAADEAGAWVEHQADEALDWAHDRLASAGSAALDAVGEVL